MSLTRRDFLTTAVLSSVSLATGGDAQTANEHHHDHDHPKPTRPAVPRVPAILCKVTGTQGIDAAYDALKQGGDTLVAALQVSKTQEDDPADSSAGLGGLPNEEGEVELDACCAHGPTRRSATVAGVPGIRNASLLARAVMERTGHTLLVGAAAQRFAAAQGFSKEDLLTERSRMVWTLWKQIRSTPDLLGPGIRDPNWPEATRSAPFLPRSQNELEQLVRKLEPLATQVGLGPQWIWRAVYDALFPVSATLYVSAVNQNSEVSGVATTSGLPWRLAGTASDVAVFGAGCYIDPEIGSAGATGNADANIKIGGARIIVENMRRGVSPEEAGMDALRRIAHWYKNDMNALRFVQMVYYILRKDGAYGGVSLWHGDPTGHARQFTIHDGLRRTEDCLFLFQGNPADGCPDKC